MHSSGSLSHIDPSYNQNNNSTARERIVHFEPHVPREPENEPKLASVSRQISEMFQQLKTCTIDEISKSMGIDPVTLFEKREKDKKPDIETLVSGLKYYLTRMLKYHTTIKEINEKKRDRGALALGNDDVISGLESDLKAALREQEKLKLIVETSQMKIKLLEKKNEELSSQSKKQFSESQSEKTRLRTQLKSQTEQLKLLQEENLVFQRPATGVMSSIKKGRQMRPSKSTMMNNTDFIEKDYYEGVSNLKAANAGDDLKLISTQMDQNKLQNLQLKQDLKEFRRKAELEREKELTIKQKDLLISRLNIQVTERERDIVRLRADYEQVFNDLKKMKEKEAERERKEWSKEVLSENNPHIIEHYKKELEKSQEKIILLKKQLRKYALGEKKVFIKEKAFELERAEYQDKMGYLQDRVTKLIKVNEDIKKAKDEVPKDNRFRRKKENTLNKSLTSSDDGMEAKPAGGFGFDTIGLSPNSYGKSPKVAFEKRPSGKSVKTFFH